jgi:hypothetical protein
MSIFYPDSDIHVQWPGLKPLGYHYSAIKGPLAQDVQGHDYNYVYYTYDGKPNKIDIYGISIEVPLNATDIDVYVKCKAKAHSSIPAVQDPNDSHLVVTLGYNDNIIDEVYISKNYANLTRGWQEFTSLVSLSQPHHFHHYHSQATPGLEEEFMIGHPKPDIFECRHTEIKHAPPPAILSAPEILNEINYIAVTGVLVDPTSWLYVASLAVEVKYV